MAARTPNTPTVQVQNEPPITPLVPGADVESEDASGDDTQQATAEGGDD